MAVAGIECKTKVVDLQDLLATIDRKRRLAGAVAEELLGWRPEVVGSVLVLPDESGPRKRVANKAAIFEASLPGRTMEVRRWLVEPTGALSGIWFLHERGGRADKGA